MNSHYKDLEDILNKAIEYFDNAKGRNNSLDISFSNFINIKEMS